MPSRLRRVATVAVCLGGPLAVALAVDSWLGVWGLLVGVDLLLAVGLGGRAAPVFDPASDPREDGPATDRRDPGEDVR